MLLVLLGRGRMVTQILGIEPSRRARHRAWHRASIELLPSSHRGQGSRQSNHSNALSVRV